MVVLWTLCAAHAWWRSGTDIRATNIARAVVLLGLVFVPGVLYWSARRDVYPSVNPDSGGATGASLLGSTLGIVFIFGALPLVLRVPRRRINCHLIGDIVLGGGRWFWVALAGSMGVFGIMDHGNASHHAWGQILGLGLLIAWVPLAWLYFREFDWDVSARPWLAAAFAWWLLLVATGWLTFLPGLSERLKFTNRLVAHAHLAMAGLVTSVNFVILRQFAPQAEPRGNFALWQTACIVMVVALLALGWLERDHAGELFRGEAWTQGVYALRLGAGVAMLAASIRWLGKAVRV
jgi:cytochrome c oxidase cbb3-type subunit 1